MKKIKIIFSNIQMRNIIYLVFGIICCTFLILVCRTRENDRNNFTDGYNEIISKYSKMETYFYAIYYNNEIIDGYFIAGKNSVNLNDLENVIKPSNIYNLIKDEEYIKLENDYVYNLDKKIVITIDDSDVIKVVYDDIIIEYGG